MLLLQITALASTQSEKAFKELDCEFKDCNNVKVVEKEKTIYVDRLIVEKKIVEKIVHKDKEAEVVAPVKKQTNTNIQYNRANIDCTINGQSVVNDYVEYDSTGFDFTKFRPRLINSGNASVFCSIFGYLEIQTDKQTLDLHVTSPRHGRRTAIINDLYYNNGKNLNTKIVTKDGIKYIKYTLIVNDYYTDHGYNGTIQSSDIDSFLTDATTLPLISIVEYAQKRGEKDVITPIDTTKIFLFNNKD